MTGHDWLSLTIGVTSVTFGLVWHVWRFGSLRTWWSEIPLIRAHHDTRRRQRSDL